MKTPREQLFEKYSHRESDLDDVAIKLCKHWQHAHKSLTNEAQKDWHPLAAILNWRIYWYGLGATWIVIGLLHVVTAYQSTTTIQNQNVKWSGDLNLILHHYAAVHKDELEWMDDVDPISILLDDQQLPQLDKTPGPQGWLNLRSQKRGISPRAPIPAEERRRYLECGGSTPLWIPKGYHEAYPTFPAYTLAKKASPRSLSKQTCRVRGVYVELKRFSGVRTIFKAVSSHSSPDGIYLMFAASNSVWMDSLDAKLNFQTV